jgi:hypothetical protein
MTPQSEVIDALEELEKWLNASPFNDCSLDADTQSTKEKYLCVLRFKRNDLAVVWAPTLSAAILSALAKAKGGVW